MFGCGRGVTVTPIGVIVYDGVLMGFIMRLSFAGGLVPQAFGKGRHNAMAEYRQALSESENWYKPVPRGLDVDHLNNNMTSR